VLEIRELKDQPGVFAVVTFLNDDIHYWPAPEENGDILIGLTWRGLASNRVRLGLGATGGEIKDDAIATATPFASLGTQKGDDGPTNDLVGYLWSGDRIRFLEQATFGPTPALDTRIRRIGLRTWLAEQFDAPYPSASNPYPNIPLMSATNN